MRGSMDWIPNTNIANPPMNSMCLEYFIAALVPNIPMNCQMITKVILAAATTNGFAPSITPWAARTKFSMLPKINNPKKGLYSEKLI